MQLLYTASSVYFHHHSTSCDFKTNESWIVLSPMEQRIKQKIEAVGTPLKEWDINIYRGILTGYNEAFIIDGKKKDELIAEDPKSAEIIRPILNDKSIKKYRINFEEKYLINSHNGDRKRNLLPVNLEKDYPTVYKHILKVILKIEGGEIQRKRGHTDKNKSFYDRTDKGITPFNLRNCAYLEKFEFPKIIWKQTSAEKTFAFDDKQYFLDVSGQMLTCQSNNIEILKYILAFLNSKLLEFYVRIQATSFGSMGTRWIPQFIELLPIPLYKNTELIELVTKIINSEKENDIGMFEKKIDSLIYSIYGVSEEEIKFIESQ